MVLLLRIAAAAFALGAGAAAALFVPWSDWFGREEGLAVLPEQQADIVLFTSYVLSGDWLVIQPLVYWGSGALILLALARVIERLASLRQDQAGPADVAGAPGSPKPVLGRLASARVLRIAAVVVVVTWIIFDALSGAAFLWWGPAAESQWGFESAYLLGGLVNLAAKTVFNGAIVLVLVALAAIMDQLDQPGSTKK